MRTYVHFYVGGSICTYFFGLFGKHYYNSPFPLPSHLPHFGKNFYRAQTWCKSTHDTPDGSPHMGSPNCKKKGFGFFDQKDNRAPPPPPEFCKNYGGWRDWPRDLKFCMWHPSSGEIRNPPAPPIPVIFAKTRKNFISKFTARRSQDRVPMHKIKIVEKVHISCTEKNFSPIGWRV